MTKKYDRSFFQDDYDEAGIHWDNFQVAIQIWSAMQPRKTTVREAADAFHVEDAVIRAAVEDHYWMFLTGPDDDPTKQIIEHEGE